MSHRKSAGASLNLAGNPAVPSTLLMQVYDDMPENWRGAILDKLLVNPNCPVELFYDQRLQFNYLGKILKNPNVPYDVLKALSKRSPEALRAVMLAHNKVEVEDLVKTFDDNFSGRETRYTERAIVNQVLASPKCPSSLVIAVLDAGGEIWQLADALRSPGFPPELYQKYIDLALNPRVDKSFRNGVIANLNLKPSDAIKMLKNTDDIKSLENILIRTKFSPEVLDTLSRKYTKEMYLRYMIQNPNMSDTTLHRLVQSPNKVVHAAARWRLAIRKELKK